MVNEKLIPLHGPPLRQELIVYKDGKKCGIQNVTGWTGKQLESICIALTKVGRTWEIISQCNH